MAISYRRPRIQRETRDFYRVSIEACCWLETGGVGNLRELLNGNICGGRPGGPRRSASSAGTN
eukprot:3571519-Pyramimonas_sp.AAC.1